MKNVKHSPYFTAFTLNWKNTKVFLTPCRDLTNLEMALKQGAKSMSGAQAVEIFVS